MTHGNEPAQPTIEHDNNGGTIQGFGLTKREHFAAMAMKGMYNNGVMTESGRIDRSPDGIARHAVQAADALIEALNLTP